MISVYFSLDYLELANGSRKVYSSTTKREIVHIGENVISMIDKIIRNKYHNDYCSPLVRAFSNASAMLVSLLAVYDVCPKTRLIGRIFHIVGFVASFFTGNPNFNSFVLNEEGYFKFIYQPEFGIRNNR